MADSSFILPSIVLIAILCGLHARIDVYRAFVCGARDGLVTLMEVAPYLCVMLTATALMRVSGVLDALQNWMAPILGAIGLPKETASVVLLRPLSGSAALGAVRDVMNTFGPDSRAARICCIISAASETIFFTGALYLGAAQARSARYAVPAALLAYLAGVVTAGWITV